MKYPAQFLHEGGAVTVRFRDIPEAEIRGQDLTQARERASEALATAMDFYFAERRVVPEPSPPQDGESAVAMPLSVAIKVLLLNEVLRQGVRPSDLARAMGLRPQDITRLLEPRHQTKIDTLAAAFDALGRKLEFSLGS